MGSRVASAGRLISGSPSFSFRIACSSSSSIISNCPLAGSLARTPLTDVSAAASIALRSTSSREVSITFNICVDTSSSSALSAGSTQTDRPCPSAAIFEGRLTSNFFDVVSDMIPLRGTQQIDLKIHFARMLAALPDDCVTNLRNPNEFTHLCETSVHSGWSESMA